MKCKYCGAWLGTNEEATSHAGKCPALEPPHVPTPITKRITARYEGWCGKCGMRVYVGDAIDYDYEMRRATHATCPPFGTRPSFNKMSRYQMAILNANRSEHAT